MSGTFPSADQATLRLGDVARAVGAQGQQLGAGIEQEDKAAGKNGRRHDFVLIEQFGAPKLVAVGQRRRR